MQHLNKFNMPNIFRVVTSNIIYAQPDNKCFMKRFLLNYMLLQKFVVRKLPNHRLATYVHTELSYMLHYSSSTAKLLGNKV